jgi:hypothetical protein
VVILYDALLLLSALAGGAIGALVTTAHHERTALRHWAYEKEVAEGREIYAALALYRHTKPGHSPDEKRTGA